MLDLKLALYLPFLAAMQPGVFVTASDDIEVKTPPSPRYCPPLQVFCLSPGLTGGQGETITALAHPSSLYIGTTHGVYVLGQGEGGGEPQGDGEGTLQDLTTCREVLQKPSVDLMRSRGAVLQRDGQETVYSDSAFWFHAATTRKLVSLHSRLAPLTSELCIYGDLLTCLGEREDKDYVAKLHSVEMEVRQVFYFL